MFLGRQMVKVDNDTQRYDSRQKREAVVTRREAAMMLRELWKDQSATATVEYALLTAVIVVAGAAAWIALQDAIGSALADIVQTFSEGSS